MKKLFQFIPVIVLSVISLVSNAQTGGRDFTAVDAYVKSLGSLENMSMGTINNVVSNKFTDKMDKARAIYYWITHNISYDIKAARNNSTMKNSPTEVLASRTAVGLGFASLFQDMCSSADIRCLTVDGYVKNSPEQINEKDVEINHSWAVVQLGQSPDNWYYVDPAWGSGYASADMKEFTPSFSDAYFFADKANFNLQHFPDNEAWKLGPAPRNKKDFFELPIVKTAALELGLRSFSPKDGYIKNKAGKTLYFSYALNPTAEISKVQLSIGERRKYTLKEMDFVFTDGKLNFSYKFQEEDSYPITVFVNGKEMMVYYLEIN